MVTFGDGPEIFRRDGIGFLRWVESFFDISKEQAQINIKKDFTSKMKMSPNDASRDTMEKAWLDGLSLWKTVNGNNEFDRVSLQTYYVAIRDGLPDKPFEAPLPRLRQWIAEKLHEMSPIFATPQLAITKILDFAEVAPFTTLRTA